MRHTAVILNIAALIVLAGAAVPANGDDPKRPAAKASPGWIAKDTADPFAGTVLFSEKPTAIAVRVVDPAGHGVAGARIYNVDEATHPLPRLVNEKNDALYGPTDELGWLRVEEPSVSWDHLLVLAEGSSTSTAGGQLEERTRARFRQKTHNKIA